MKRYVFLSISMLLFIALPEIGMSCPNCKAAYIDGGGPVSAGYNSSILFMMIIPFVVMSIVAVRIYISMKKKARAGSAAGDTAA